MVLDDNQGIATGRQATQQVPENLDILQVKTRSGFVQKIDHLPCRFPGKFRRKLQPLGFAARKGGDRLAQPQVTEAHVPQAFQLGQNFRLVLEELAGFVDTQVQNVGDVLALESNRKGFLVVTLATADFAGFPDVRKEMHFHRDGAAAFAGLAAATGQVVTETAVVEALHLGLWQFGE